LNQYTWWDVKSGARNRNIGWRIDYVIVDESLKKNIVDTKIYSEIYGSDHCPISITVKI
jgi:exodeoxyribonuclease-3